MYIEKAIYSWWAYSIGVEVGTFVGFVHWSTVLSYWLPQVGKSNKIVWL